MIYQLNQIKIMNFKIHIINGIIAGDKNKEVQ